MATAPFAIHTRENGASYNNTVVVRGGKVGINNTWPNEKLTIGPNLGDWLGDYISICNDDSVAGVTFGQGTNDRFYMYRSPDGKVGMHNLINGYHFSGITLDSNKIGIMSLEPQAAVSIGSNVGNYYGTWLTIGDAATAETGIIFGKDEDNNCGIARNGAGQVNVRIKDAGTHYTNLTMYRTNLGVGLDQAFGGPNEKLVVGKDLGSFFGDRIVIGDDTQGSQTGLVFGRDNHNRGWLLWDINSGYAAMGCRSEGVNYSNTLTFRHGRVGLNTNTPSQELHVVGDICYTGSIGACSNLRYKRKVHTIDNALDKVSQLRGVSFEWKQDEYPDMKFTDQEQIGLVAQEVKNVVPQVISETDDGYYNVDYSKLTALLVEAVKD